MAAFTLIPYTAADKKNKELTMQLIQLSDDYSWAYGQLQKLKSEIEQKKGEKS